MLLNISKSPLLRDITLRLCAAIMSNNRGLADECLEQLLVNEEQQEEKEGETAAVRSLTSRFDLTRDLAAATSVQSSRIPLLVQEHPSVFTFSASSMGGGGGGADGNVGPSRQVLGRLIITLSHLVSNNQSIVFDLLRPRLIAGGEALPMETAEDKDTAPISSDAKDPSEPSLTAAASVVAESKEVASALSSSTLLLSPTLERKEPGRVVADAKTEGKSTGALLELFVSLLSHEIVLTDPRNLLELTNFVEKVTSPLERLPLDGSAASDVKPELDAKRANDSKPVKVPVVGMEKESLRSLCDVLLSDYCTKEIFDRVTAAISRLAKIKANQNIICDLLVEVTQDLALQSQGKLEGVFSSLSTAPPSSSSAGGVVAKVQPQLKSAPGDPPLPPSPPPIARLPTNQLPLGKVGGKQHERFLRSVQTLQSIAEKTDKKLIELIPVDQTTHLWSALEMVALQLRKYLSDDEEGDDEQTQKAAGGSAEEQPLAKSKPQSALTSLLTRLLPVIEAFILIHTSDIATEPSTLNTTPVVAAKASPASSPLSSSAAVAGGGGESPSTAAGAASTSSPRTSAVPGLRYRNNPLYQSMNLSLVTAEERSNSLHRTNSLQKVASTSSLERTNSSSSTQMTRAQRLLYFVQTHRGILNLLIRSRPALLDGSFSILMRVPQLRTHLIFENKRKYFFSQLKKIQQDRGRRMGGAHLNLRREHVFEDSYHQLRMRNAEEMRGRLQVNFHGEEGIDAGGLTREWYLVLSKAICNANYALFTAAADGATFQPNPHSKINPDHLDYFKFVGRVVGKAICDEQLMDVHFTRSFYKHVLGVPVDLLDIEAVEPDYYKSLKQILDMPIEDLGVELTFSAENVFVGKHDVVDLIPDGRTVAVTDENKHDYARLVAQHRMTTAIRSQIDAFLDGFYDLVPPHLVTIFSPTELELLICGLPDVDIEDLHANTEYTNFQPVDAAIVWFWEVLRAFNREEKALFLQFVTGTSKVPLDGFAHLQGMRGEQRFSIHRAYGNPGMLPAAHTCFNQLDLPAYGSLEEMREKLLLAIKEGSEGFGFA